jgi:hypothetical protein
LQQKLGFFFDNHISPKIVNFLRELNGVDLFHLTDKFPPNAKDPDWIPAVTLDGLIIISADRNMTRVRLEAHLLKEHKARAFFLSKFYAGQPRISQASLMCKYWPAIVERAASMRPGQMYIVKNQGTHQPI